MMPRSNAYLYMLIHTYLCVCMCVCAPAFNSSSTLPLSFSYSFFLQCLIPFFGCLSVTVLILMRNFQATYERVCMCICAHRSSHIVEPQPLCYSICKYFSIWYIYLNVESKNEMKYMNLLIYYTGVFISAFICTHYIRLYSVTPTLEY